MKQKVLLAMSGGIDSSVSAALLKERGFGVLGVTMDLSGAEVNTSVNDAKAAAELLSIPHYVVDAAAFFEQTVISYFINEYKSGRTPNPCVECNRRLKFGLLMDKAEELECDYLATGHYAVISNGGLKRGADVRKDQSYFLYPILASPLDKIMFPLGELTKDDVRALAKRFNLPAAEKSESQDICFIPSGNYLDFFKSRGIGRDGITAGNIVDTDGNVLGTHTGVHNFTVGQRKGLGAFGKRMYVKRINIADNTVIAADEHQLDSSEITISDVIVSKRGIDVNRKYQVQIRYRSRPADAAVAGINDVDAVTESNGIGIRTLRLKFDSPVRAVSPGQSAVIYDGDVVVAGGVIIQ